MPKPTPRRLPALLLCAALVPAGLAGCGGSDSSDQASPDGGSNTSKTGVPKDVSKAKPGNGNGGG